MHTPKLFRMQEKSASCVHVHACICRCVRACLCAFVCGNYKHLLKYCVMQHIMFDGI